MSKDQLKIISTHIGLATILSWIITILLARNDFFFDTAGFAATLIILTLLFSGILTIIHHWMSNRTQPTRSS